MARNLLGEATVLAAASIHHPRAALPDLDVADVGSALLRFDGGTIAAFANSCISPLGHVEMEFVSDGLTTTLRLGGEWPRTKWTATFEDQAGVEVVAAERDPYEAQAEAFLDAVDAGRSVAGAVELRRRAAHRPAHPRRGRCHRRPRLMATGVPRRPPQHDLILLDASRTAEAGQVIARAFRDDPLQRYGLPDRADDETVSPLMFEALVRGSLATSDVWTTPALEGVAVWRRPVGGVVDAPPATANDEHAPAADDPDDLGRIIGPEAAGRFGRFFEAIGPVHHELMPGPHWYLAILAVDPASQGRGIGGALVRRGLQDAARDSLPAYLETATERNVAFYVGLGFRVVHDSVEPESGLRWWAFGRDPDAAS